MAFNVCGCEKKWGQNEAFNAGMQTCGRKIIGQSGVNDETHKDECSNVCTRRNVDGRKCVFSVEMNINRTKK